MFVLSAPTEANPFAPSKWYQSVNTFPQSEIYNHVLSRPLKKFFVVWRPMFGIMYVVHLEHFSLFFLRTLSMVI